MSFRKRLRDWERRGEGFEGLDDKKPPVKYVKHKKPAGSCRLYDAEDDLKQGHSDEGDRIEDSIIWTSSEEENEESSFQVSRGRSKGRFVRKSTMQKDVTQKSWKMKGQHRYRQEEEEVDVISDSDSNSKEDGLMKNESESIDLDIESEDSRSSIPSKEKSANLFQSQDTTQNTCTSSCIMDQTSISASTSQSQSPDQGSKVKASQWIKMLDLKTPTKNSQDVPFSELEDSAKKRKKYKKHVGGLADQLSNLKGRERSMNSIFKHQQSTSKSEPDTPSRSLILTITSLEPLFSLQLAHCVSRDPSDTGTKEQTALFLQDKAILTGSVIQVFAPWQRIRLKSMSQLVLLCSNYRILSHEELLSEELSETKNIGRPEGQQRSNQQNSDVHERCAVWKCPCVSGLVHSPSACPAHLNPELPGLSIYQRGERCEQDSDEKLSALDTIQATRGPSRVSRLTKPSILDWLDCHDPSARFSGKILRVFCFNRKVPNSGKRYVMLIEDSHGTVCQVLCPEEAETLFPEVLQNGEGSCHVFGGLSVQCRATRERELALFSVIDVVWSGGPLCKRLDSQDTEDRITESQEPDSLTQVCRSSAPGFCYFMIEAENGEGMTAVPLGNGSSNLKENTIRLADLTHVDEIKRVSFCCKVVFQVNMASVKDGLSLSDTRRSHKSVLYVRDQSLTRSQCITTTSEFCLPECTQLTENSWKFRDVACHLGKLTCDLYSRAILQSQDTVMILPDFNPIQLHSGLSALDLCIVSGTVCGVDENSAYSWDVCDNCQQENLAQDSNTKQLVCLNCKKTVMEPLTRMKLKVYLSVTSSCEMTSSDHVTQKMKVSVELLQTSIERILPESTEAEEGYDIACVLEKTVGPLNCVVLQSHHRDLDCQMALKEVSVDHKLTYC
ncbi:DNA repair-scaffolding protein-like isoform X2 [Ostrea edulis]|uniref:DNA repair-scaffolding protein-like isoform X2 n=1 Tax=Ostrea edulis TaxID=37623 RepID=UPI0024AFD762|nr:DNA repair-scaffolding protein-like isoform X2 [Ostrea edulis]